LDFLCFYFLPQELAIEKSNICVAKLTDQIRQTYVSPSIPHFTP